MREILFRGKRKDNGEWVEGYYVRYKDEAYIFTDDEVEKGLDLGGYLDCCKMFEVDIETVGQYTGLKDKNGKKIFEGDILQTRRYETYTEELKGYYGYDDEGYPQKIPGYTGSMTVPRQRVNDDYHAVVCFSPNRGFYITGASVRIDAICNSVIGNIHDNPELLEVN